MGANTFGNRAKAKTAKEAFELATAAARYENGNGGYSGSIAEKRSFVVISVPDGKNPLDYAHDLINNRDPRVDDKWGPAGCVQLDEDTFYFFGWASS